MSMLSILINDLRLMALSVNDYSNGEISRNLREAANTIEILRERLQAYTLKAGECEWQHIKSGTLYDVFRCSKCGYEYVESRCDQHATEIEPNFCLNCGKAVKL